MRSGQDSAQCQPMAAIRSLKKWCPGHYQQRQQEKQDLPFCSTLCAWPCCAPGFRCLWDLPAASEAAVPALGPAYSGHSSARGEGPELVSRAGIQTRVTDSRTHTCKHHAFGGNRTEGRPVLKNAIFVNTNISLLPHVRSCKQSPI